MANLQRLHAAAGALAESAPAILANAETARSLEQALILAMVACATDAAEDDSLALRHHQAILRRFRALIEANVENPLYLPEICAALGSRTARYRDVATNSSASARCAISGCAECTWSAVRSLRPLPPRASVTAIATQYGFWELGRFSVAYRTLFGEPPSATLNRQP